MRAEVRPINVKGKPQPKKLREESPPCRGELSLESSYHQEFGRVVTSAKLISTLSGADTSVLPELFDASVLWFMDTKMRIRGFEVDEGVQYAQTWDVEVQKCSK